MKRSKWVLVQMASVAKREGRLDDHAKLREEIAAFDAACAHRTYTLAEDAAEPGDFIHLCNSCGNVLKRIPSDAPSGVRLRV